MTISPLTGQAHPSGDLLPAAQWLSLGFAVHPLQKGTSKAWRPEYRSMSIARRQDDLVARPQVWERIGIEPGSIHSASNWVVLDDDSHKTKYSDDQRERVREALALLLPDPDHTPCVATPSGGRHWYLRNTSDHDISQDNLPGIDILGSANVVTWPTNGYTIEHPFAYPLEDNPALDMAAYRKAAAIVKQVQIPSHMDAQAIRQGGRNNRATVLLWRCTNTALRTHTDPELAHDLAWELWTKAAANMSEILGGEDPLAWNIRMEQDFERGWEKAKANYARADEIGVYYDGESLLAWAKNPDSTKTERRPNIGQWFVMEPIASIQRQTILANRPIGPRTEGTLVELMKGGDRQFLADRDTAQFNILQALYRLTIRDVPGSVYREAGFIKTEAVKAGLKQAAEGHSWVLPTGIWWRHEFPADIAEQLPAGHDWFFFANGVLLPTGEWDDSVACAPLMAEQVFRSEALVGFTPWAIGPKGEPGQCSEMLRRIAGFQAPRTAALACCMAAMGLLRGWLRGDPTVGKAQPFVSIEGAPGSGKTTGIFGAIFALANARVAMRSEAQFTVEMSLSRAGMLVFDDQDLGMEWAMVLRQQQSEQSWSKTNSMRELLGLPVIVSNGLAILERDQALQDRCLRILVPDTVKARRSLLDPERLQVRDLSGIAPERVAAIQGEFTRLVVQAAGQVAVDEAVSGVADWWKSTAMAERQKLVFVTAEISLRVYCWIAGGCLPEVRWWDCPTADLSITLEDGSIIDLVDELRQETGRQELAATRQQAAPFGMALARYIKQYPYCNWDEHLGMGNVPDDPRKWCQQQEAWIHNGRLCVKPAAMARWAENQQWPAGVRKLLFTTQQFMADLDSLEASGIQTHPKWSVQYRRLSEVHTRDLLNNLMGWSMKQAIAVGMDQEDALELFGPDAEDLGLG